VSRRRVHGLLVWLLFVDGVSCGRRRILRQTACPAADGVPCGRRRILRQTAYPAADGVSCGRRRIHQQECHQTGAAAQNTTDPRTRRNVCFCAARVSAPFWGVPGPQTGSGRRPCCSRLWNLRVARATAVFLRVACFFAIRCCGSLQQVFYLARYSHVVISSGFWVDFQIV